MWMTAKRESIWAIGLKGYIEIRAGVGPPKAVQTSVDKNVTRRVMKLVKAKNNKFVLRWVREPYKLVLTNIIHVGGRVLNSMDANTFWRNTHLSISPGECRKLTKAQAMKCLRGGS